MQEVLQGFSTTNITSAAFTMIAFWLVWPVLCGFLGASRGQGLAGVMHGFLWGPLGLLFVLLSKRKYVCPTCGHKTLLHPLEDDERRALWDIPAVARPVPPNAIPQVTDDAPPPILHQTEDVGEPVGAYAAAREDPEVAKLRAWVSGGSD